LNIDLFLTGHNEAGLVCNAAFAHQPIGVILDAQTQELTVEFDGGETFHLNVPMEISHREKLLFAHRMYMGYLEGGLLTDSFELPLFYLNDPYGSDFGQTVGITKPKRAVVAFEQVMKRCNFAQALHRDNLGDEDSARSVLRGIDPHALKFSPALQRQIQLAAVPQVQGAPQMAGLGGTTTTQVRDKKSKKSDEEK